MATVLRESLHSDMDIEAIEAWLREESIEALEVLWQRADAVRSETVGNEVHLRGLIEISNYCIRQCGYCGLRFGNREVERYRLSDGEILACARQAMDFGYGTMVLQAGEDYGIEQAWLADIVRAIKTETPLAVTLSMGERPPEDLAAWRDAGADRYLLRFETSDPELYRRIHPDARGERSDRLAILRDLRKLGYETGSGIMLGIPGQTYGAVAKDLALFRTLDLDMIGVGPYISHPATPLGQGEWTEPASPREQTPNNELLTYKAIALTRILCPEANIPSTTALATLNRAGGRELGLQRGANVVMPNLTPVEYRAKYEIYPAKACITETADLCKECLNHRLRMLGREPGKGAGSRRHVLK